MLGAGIFDSILFNAKKEPNPCVQWLIQKYPFGIALAWLSFLFHLGGALNELIKKNNPDAYIESSLCHLLWITTCFFGIFADLYSLLS